MAEPWEVQPEDYYAILQVRRGLPNFDAVVKIQFRALALQYHPDYATDDADRADRTEQLKRINRAYDVLKDPALRAQYDAWLDAGGAETLRRSARDGARHSQQPPPRDEPRQEQRDGRPPPPKLDVDPRTINIPGVSVGQRVTIPLRIRNLGGPYDPSTFRVRTPRHPSHPAPDPQSWLYLQQEPQRAPSQEPLELALVLDTRGLRPHRHYQAQLFVDLAGQEARVDVALDTIPSASPAAGSRWFWLIGAGAAVLVLLIVGVFVLTRSNSSGSKHQATGAGVASATVARTSSNPASNLRQQVVTGTVPPSAAPLATSPEPAAAPPPAPGTVLYQADWSKGRADWVGGTDWKTINGMLVNDGTGRPESVLLAPFRVTTDAFAIDAEVQLISEGNSRGIVFRHSPVGGYFAGSDREYGAEFADEGNKAFSKQQFSAGTDNHLYHLEVRGSDYKLYIDGSFVLQSRDSRYATGTQLGLWDDHAQLTVRSYRVTALGPAAALIVSPPNSAPGTVLYEADWSSGRGEWMGGTDWKTVNGMLVNDGTGRGESVLVAPFQAPTDSYAIEAQIQLVTEGNSRGIVFRHSTSNGQDRHYFAGSDRDYGAEFADEGNKPFKTATFSAAKTDHLYRVEVRGNTYKLYIDGVLLLDAQDNRYLTGDRIGLWDDHAQLNVKTFRVIAL